MNDQPYIRGQAPTRALPLGAYLPGIELGVVRTWLTDNLAPPDWVLCPFGSSPLAALEAARSGFRVLIPIHNPVLRFLANKLAQPPSVDDLNSALAALASSYKGKERLKPHILSLYETECPQCGRTTSAATFIWDRSRREPISKICRCSTCGEESVGDITPADREKALQFSDHSPTHARALTRVTSPSDPIRGLVENALASYPPRSVYALFTALNKVTGFSLPDLERSNLDILLLHAFYRCSQTLPPSGLNEEEDQPERETYREENVWFALEDALNHWTAGTRNVPVTSWPATPPEGGGITIFPGRVKDLMPHLIGFPIQGVVMVFPQPTPEFWSMSALWSGWLWGQEAAAPLRGILTSRDLDWPWMTRASQITLRELSDVLPDQIPALGLMPGLRTRSLLSWTSASLSAGLALDNLAVDPDQRQGQSLWTINPPDSGGKEGIDHRVSIREAGLAALKSSGEPLHTLTVYSAGMARLAEAGYPGETIPAMDAGEGLPRLEQDFEENIAYRQGFLHYPGIEGWWHMELDLGPLPQSDQVEIKVVQSLLAGAGPIDENQLFRILYGAFPGQASPRSGLVQACLESYAARDPDQSSSWELKPNDLPSRRIQDLTEMEEIITWIGRELGYQTRIPEAPENLSLVVWESGSQPVERFYLSASGLLSKVIARNDPDHEKGWIVLPGSRAALIHYKMRNNPVLADTIQKNWRLIKYRHLRRLREQGGLTRTNYRERFSLDPFTSDSPQLPLI